MAGEARAAAARAIGAVLEGKSLNQTLPMQLDRVPERDRALVQQLCYGTLRQAPLLQGLLDQLLQKPLRGRDRDVHGLLLCGLYQLSDTRVPDHAAVSETVAAVAVLKKGWARGMTNAVLRRFLRERDALYPRLDAAARLAHPAWLLEARYLALGRFDLLLKLHPQLRLYLRNKQIEYLWTFAACSLVDVR